MENEDIKIEMYAEASSKIGAWLETANEVKEVKYIKRSLAYARRVVDGFCLSLDKQDYEFFDPYIEELTNMIDLREARLEKLVNAGRILK